jgi:hypothetical protein
VWVTTISSADFQSIKGRLSVFSSLLLAASLCGQFSGTAPGIAPRFTIVSPAPGPDPAMLAAMVAYSMSGTDGLRSRVTQPRPFGITPLWLPVGIYTGPMSLVYPFVP